MFIRYVSFGEIARVFRRPLWMVQRTCDRGFFDAEPIRVGNLRVVREDRLPEVEAALRRAGYLPAAEVASAI
jgi:hypothetical protein